MKLPQEFAKWQGLYNHGYRFNPTEKKLFMFVSKELEYNPDDFTFQHGGINWEIVFVDKGEYLNERLAPITELTNRMLGYRCKTDGRTIEVKDVFEKHGNLDIYKSSKHGDILMFQYTLERQMLYYNKFFHPRDIEDAIKDGKNIIAYKNAIRLNPIYQTILFPDSKYNYTNFEPRPFFDPELVRLYETYKTSDHTLQTLILTEGQFKAFVANRIGLPVIGLSSTTHWRNKGTNAIHDDIIKFTKKTEPNNIVLLWDGDCFNLGRGTSKEPHIRPIGFYKNAYNIIMQLRTFFPDTRIFFSCINTDNLDLKPKGLDDLILAYNSDEDINEIYSSFVNVIPNNPFFKSVEVTTNTQRELINFFNKNKK